MLGVGRVEQDVERVGLLLEVGGLLRELHLALLEAELRVGDLRDRERHRHLVLAVDQPGLVLLARRACELRRVALVGRRDLLPRGACIAGQAGHVVVRVLDALHVRANRVGEVLLERRLDRRRLLGRLHLGLGLAARVEQLRQLILDLHNLVVGRRDHRRDDPRVADEVERRRRDVRDQHGDDDREDAEADEAIAGDDELRRALGRPRRLRVGQADLGVLGELALRLGGDLAVGDVAANRDRCGVRRALHDDERRLGGRLHHRHGGLQLGVVLRVRHQHGLLRRDRDWHGALDDRALAEQRHRRGRANRAHLRRPIARARPDCGGLGDLRLHHGLHAGRGTVAGAIPH